MILRGDNKKFTFSLALCDMAHQYIPMNITIMAPWLRSNYKFVTISFKYNFVVFAL
jgi:hypothetical protein